jgi:hypothetical protein
MISKYSAKMAFPPARMENAIGLVDRPGGGFGKYLSFPFCVISILAGQELKELSLKRAIFERGAPLNLDCR